MACPHSEDQWPNYFHHETSSTDMMTTDSVITTSSMSPSHSSASPKPIRRRSRASKKTPTTLLNADASNFRALVQQFTGRPSPPSVITPGAQRGPVNINFGQAAHDQASGSGYSSYGYCANNPQLVEYDQQRYNGYAETFVGDGFNVDDMDWGTLSSSTSHGNDAHHFM